ncbi:hypothetical protein SAMN04489810_3335 [Microbacterium pygmaeum]|uniref:Uncharacterized protein n=1 Tax=Microbacterium pygmaeum TaxID=370764 RepID=A0A1G8DFR2_9MICO|nr:hypothetical protein SAMN04489810_3335 [Microbacterium pygmaeum]
MRPAFRQLHKEAHTQEWDLRADNGQVIATGFDRGHVDEIICRRMADRIIGGIYAHSDKRIHRGFS